MAAGNYAVPGFPHSTIVPVHDTYVWLPDVAKDDRLVLHRLMALDFGGSRSTEVFGYVIPVVGLGEDAGYSGWVHADLFSGTPLNKPGTTHQPVSAIKPVDLSFGSASEDR